MPVTVESGVTGPYVPNGVTTGFAFTFKADSASEVVVVDQEGAELSSALYSVSLNSGEGGTVTFSVAPALADYDEIYIVSDPAMTQGSDFGNTGPSFNPASLTRALDRAAIRDIALKRELERSLKVPFGETVPPTWEEIIDLFRGERGLPGTGNVIGLTPEDSDAVGNGVVNDTDAFQELADTINDAGAGVAEFAPGATYIIGRQNLVNDGTDMFMGESLLHFASCDVAVRGNNATLELAPSLRFGNFNADGSVRSTTAPHLTLGYRSQLVPNFEAMLSFEECDKVFVDNLTIDGNQDNLNWGGEQGDHGWQLNGEGMVIYNCGQVLIENVTIRNCARDAMYIIQSGEQEPHKTITFRSCLFEECVRQGVSISGGRGVLFDHCVFRNIGRGGHYSAPGAGVDIEAEFVPVRDIKFTFCSFYGCRGVSALADSGDSDRITFEDCFFGSGLAWAAWLNKPGMKFKRCIFAGGVQIPQISDPDYDAPLFEDCVFTDDPDLTPAGEIAGTAGISSGGAFHASRPKFIRATIDYTRTLAAGTVGGLYFEEVTLNTGALAPQITGVLCVGTVKVVGNDPGLTSFGGWTYRPGSYVTFNGVRRNYGSATYDPASLADGARATTTVAAPGARLGDKARATFSLALAGVDLKAAVSAADTVQVHFDNESGGTIDLASGTLKVFVEDQSA